MRRTLAIAQPELGRRMGKATITIAKWETVRSPSGQSLVDLRDFARANHLPAHEFVFEFALRQSVLADPQRRTISYAGFAEMEAMLAARHMVRSKQTYRQALKEVRLLLKDFQHDPERLRGIELLDFAVGQSTDRPEAVLKVLTELHRQIAEGTHE
jgi:hypothetical protein